MAEGTRNSRFICGASEGRGRTFAADVCRMGGQRGWR